MEVGARCRGRGSRSSRWCSASTRVCRRTFASPALPSSSGSTSTTCTRSSTCCPPRCSATMSSGSPRAPPSLSSRTAARRTSRPSGWTLPQNPDVGESIDADVHGTHAGRHVGRRIARSSACPTRSSAAPPAFPTRPTPGHAHYPLALAWLDAGVGLVLDALERNGLVAFTADHHSLRQAPLLHLRLAGAAHRPMARARAAADRRRRRARLAPRPAADDLGRGGVQPSLRALAGGAADRRCPARARRRCSSEGPSDSLHAHLFCEIGQSRAVFTERARLLYAPQLKPLAKGGSTDTRNNYQAHRHHPAYWRPLQLYDLGADADEMVNLANDTARARAGGDAGAAARARLEGDACA